MKSIDVFGKPVQEFQVKTAIGGYLSVFSLLLIGALFVTEFRYFLQLETKDELIIDQNQDRKYLNVTFDITFAEVPCSILYMNLVDPKKANVMHVVHEVYKQRVTPQGKPIGRKIRDSLRDVAATSSELVEAGSRNTSVQTEHATVHLRCGSCFGTHVDEDDCCNSCEEVRKNFREKGLNPRPTDFVFEQCEEEVYAEKPPLEQEGCEITAKMTIRKVASTIHVGVGRLFKAQFVKTPSLDFVTHLNFAHKIHQLTFGPDFPGMVKVLDGRDANAHVPPNTEHFQYDLHVIPTRYIEFTGEEIVSHQYSVTEYVKSIDQTQRHNELVSAGLIANYDFTPFEVRVTKTRKKFTHFLTECCAILGGIFAFTGMLDNFSYRINKSMARRSASTGTELTPVPPRS